MGRGPAPLPYSAMCPPPQPSRGVPGCWGAAPWGRCHVPGRCRTAAPRTPGPHRGLRGGGYTHTHTAGVRDPPPPAQPEPRGEGAGWLRGAAGVGGSPGGGSPCTEPPCSGSSRGELKLRRKEVAWGKKQGVSGEKNQGFWGKGAPSTPGDGAGAELGAGTEGAPEAEDPPRVPGWAGGCRCLHTRRHPRAHTCPRTRIPVHTRVRSPAAGRPPPPGDKAVSGGSGEGLAWLCVCVLSCVCVVVCVPRVPPSTYRFAGALLVRDALGAPEVHAGLARLAPQALPRVACRQRGGGGCHGQGQGVPPRPPPDPPPGPPSPPHTLAPTCDELPAQLAGAMLLEDVLLEAVCPGGGRGGPGSLHAPPRPREEALHALAPQQRPEGQRPLQPLHLPEGPPLGWRGHPPGVTMNPGGDGETPQGRQ